MASKCAEKASALAAGLSRYFTGVPCIRGHVCDRYIRGGCVICVREWSRDHARKPEVIVKRKNWWKNNPEKALEYSRKSYAAKGESLRANASRWKRANPDKVNVINQNRRAARASATGTLTHAMTDARMKEQKSRCAWCGTKITRRSAHIDHVVPLARGGEHSSRNFVMACAPCNLKKGAKDPLVWARETGRIV